MNKVKYLFYYVFTYWYYKAILGGIGKLSRVFKPLQIDKPGNIYVGNNVVVGKLTWLAANPLTGAANCRLTIGNGARIGNFNHIYCTSRITIEDKVLTADKVYISDNLHSYEDTTTAITDQPIKQVAEITIGAGSWLGENVCVIGASVGKGCVIGANSVVTKNIPDYCVAVGAPAKVIKRYNHQQQIWEKAV